MVTDSASASATSPAKSGRHGQCCSGSDANSALPQCYCAKRLSNKLRQDQKKGRALPLAAEKVEALWTAAVLSHYSEQLRGYLQLKDAFHSAVSASKYKMAAVALAEIENTYGVSLWAISSRITLLQLQGGNTVQKSFLQAASSGRTNATPIRVRSGNAPTATSKCRTCCGNAPCSAPASPMPTIRLKTWCRGKEAWRHSKNG